MNIENAIAYININICCKYKEYDKIMYTDINVCVCNDLVMK